MDCFVVFFYVSFLHDIVFSCINHPCIDKVLRWWGQWGWYVAGEHIMLYISLLACLTRHECLLISLGWFHYIQLSVAGGTPWGRDGSEQIQEQIHLVVLDKLAGPMVRCWAINSLLWDYDQLIHGCSWCYVADATASIHQPSLTHCYREVTFIWKLWWRAEVSG